MLKSDEKNDSRDEKEKERFLTNSVFLNPQMQLRKIVNHPYLIQFPLIEGTEELRIDEDLVKESGKMLVLDALLAKLKAGGHKVYFENFHYNSRVYICSVSVSFCLLKFE